jgi:hypothetical protein
VRSLPICAALALVVGCAKSEPAQKIDPQLIEISPVPVIRHDQVGEGEFETRATYVLVDAENTSEHDALVTLAGTLHDAGGAQVGTLRPESVRIPRGGTRTFALVDDRNQERAAATRAELMVRGAVVPKWKPAVEISDVQVFDDRGRVVVAGNVTNQADRPGRIIILAGFHDAAGAPMSRPFVVLEMGSGIEKTVRFVGPEGSKTGYLFLGDATF